MEKKIAHLKLHTEFSLLEGVGKIEEYIGKALEQGVGAMAITDTAMFGVIEFYKKCRKAGIKPLIGLEVFLDGIVSEGEYSLTLLARNMNGYRNLCKISSLSYSRFNRRRNKIKYEELSEYSDGLFILSGGIHGEIVAGLNKYKYPEARKVAMKLREDFGESFYIEIPAAIRLENVRKSLFEIIRETGMEYIISNDVYYPEKGDAVLQKILSSIKEGNRIEVEKSEILYDDLYLKSYDDLKANFSGFDEALFNRGLKNIGYIVDECNIEFEFNRFKFPKYDLPKGISESEYIKKLAYEGAAAKYLGKSHGTNARNEFDGSGTGNGKGESTGNHTAEEIAKELEKNNLGKVRERLEYELGIIDSMGYNGYFIIVWDFIRFAKRSGVFVGPGRGSAAGSLVSYVLDITEIDPLEHNLIFERFLNPERVSMPDIDIDFDQEQREIVIDYVLNKYGAEHVAHIITFGTLKARAAIRDVGRVLNINLKKVDTVAKYIPFNMDLKEALSSIGNLRNMYDEDSEVRAMIDYSMKIEGRVRHASVHAAGLVITEEVIDQEIPTYSDGKTAMLSTQYQMKELEDLGILKIDFLGLKNLTILRKTIENIEKTRGRRIFLSEIELTDRNSYNLMTRADTLGIFQCESQGIRSLMKRVRIEKFDDITALLSLYRPGPLQSGMVEDFIAAKNNDVKIKYPHESLKHILEETYGVILYQEQVMKIASEMADYSLGEADELRRAMGKKIPAIIEQNREKFVSNAVRKGIEVRKAEEVYNLIDKFGGYGFNKSHSAAYALIVYWTAYFKANYPLEFFAGVMSTEMYNIDRLSLFINEAREKNINILVPDVSLSDAEFKVTDEGIRFGMTAIKGIGRGFVTDMIEERKEPFTSYEDFVYRMKQHGLNRKQLESLILSGSLDKFHGNRQEKYLSIDKVLKWAGKKYEKDEELLSLFGNKVSEAGEFRMENSPEFPRNLLLKNEKEYLGIYVSDHPLASKKAFIEMIDHMKISELESPRNRRRIGKSSMIRLAGMVKNVTKSVTRSSGEPMAKFQLEDFTGTIEILCFPRDFVKSGYKITEDATVIVEGRIHEEGSKYSVIMDAINGLDDLDENDRLKLYILIDDGSMKRQDELKRLIKASKGSNPVFLAMDIGGRKEVIGLDRKYNVTLSSKFMAELVRLVGEKKIKLR